MGKRVSGIEENKAQMRKKMKEINTESKRRHTGKV